MMWCHCDVNSAEKSANSAMECLLLVTCIYTLSGSPLTGTSFYQALSLATCEINYLFLVNCACWLMTFPAVQVGGGAAHTFSIDSRVVGLCRQQ